MISLNKVGFEEDSLKEKAQRLASQLNFNLDKDADTCLFVSSQQLGLKIPHFSLLYADFDKKKIQGKKPALVRAVKPAPGLNLIDTTAGWGKDAAILAHYGANVLMLERHPIMALLLADALERCQQNLKLSLKHEEAYTYLSHLEAKEYPDVIYIDPMHPERTKSALVKKELQALQQMIGRSDDALELLRLARKKAKLRVVVKWPQKEKPLLPVSSSINGKTVRFDIYGVDPERMLSF